MGVTTDDTQLFARALRAMRETLNYSQMGFAVALGVHLHTIQRWESGETLIPPHSLETIRCRLNHDGHGWQYGARWRELLARNPTVEQVLREVGWLDAPAA